MWSRVWVQVAGLTRCSVPSEVTWEEEVILMPSQCYWCIVTSETGAWWVGAMPLGAFAGSRRSWCACTHTNRYSHPPCALTKPSLTHRLKWPPRGAIVVPLVANVALKQAREISRLSEKRIEMRGQVCWRQLASTSCESFLPCWATRNAISCFYCCILIKKSTLLPLPPPRI